MKTTTEIQLVPIAKLVLYVNNAHTHSPEQITKLRSSLREFGFINPVIIDRDLRDTKGTAETVKANPFMEDVGAADTGDSSDTAQQSTPSRLTVEIPLGVKIFSG